jgi:importin subunit alpha-1
MTDLLALLAEQIRGDDPILQLDAVTKIRKLLTLENTPPVQQVLALNILHRVVHFLASESPELQFEAAWTLTNIASGSSPETRAVVDADAVRHLVALLRSPHNQVREQAVWALGNIAGDSPHYRDHVLSHGAMPLLLDCFNDMSRDSLVRNAIWTLSNFCRGKPQPSFDIVRPALAVLAFMIRGDDAELLADACWALSYLSDGSNDKIQAVLDAGVLPHVVQLLYHQAFAVQIGNIVTGDDHDSSRRSARYARRRAGRSQTSPAATRCRRAKSTVFPFVNLDLHSSIMAPSRTASRCLGLQHLGRWQENGSSAELLLPWLIAECAWRWS